MHFRGVGMLIPKRAGWPHNSAISFSRGTTHRIGLPRPKVNSTTMSSESAQFNAWWNSLPTMPHSLWPSWSEESPVPCTCKGTSNSRSGSPPLRCAACYLGTWKIVEARSSKPLHTARRMTPVWLDPGELGPPLGRVRGRTSKPPMIASKMGLRGRRYVMGTHGKSLSIHVE